MRSWCSFSICVREFQATLIYFKRSLILVNFIQGTLFTLSTIKMKLLLNLTLYNYLHQTQVAHPSTVDRWAWLNHARREGGGVVCERTRSLDPRLGKGDCALVLLLVGVGEAFCDRLGLEHSVRTSQMP